MGAVAGPNLIVLMLTAMEHDLTFRINMKMDSRMRLSMTSIFHANRKSALLSELSQYDPEKQRAQYEGIRKQLEAFEQKERVIAALDKQLEMELTKLQNELKMTQQRKESEEKMLDKNIQGAFSMGQR